MHARKLPRISEPSFDRDYGNGSSGSRAYRDRSPSDVANRGMSPRDRSKYGRRDRDNRDYYKYSRGSRDRRSDRSPKDRKWESSSSRRGDRSPKDRKWDRGGDRDQRIMDRDGGHHHLSGCNAMAGNNSSSANNPPLESKLRSVGDWTEHTSSSGKKYYYNSVTEVSREYSSHFFIRN